MAGTVRLHQASRTHDEARSRDTAQSSRSTLVITLLDSFSLACAGEPVDVPPSCERVVAFLALEPRPVQRRYLAEKLWFGAVGSHPEASLRSALWRIRCSCAPLIQTSRSSLRLIADALVDVREQVSVAHRLLEGGHSGGVNDIATLQGELLPDWGEAWVAFERDRLRQLRLHALDELAEHALVQRRYGVAVEACLAALRSDPLRESAHIKLIQTYLAEANRVDALHQYQACTELLGRKAQLDPTPALKELLPALVDE